MVDKGRLEFVWLQSVDNMFMSQPLRYFRIIGAGLDANRLDAEDSEDASGRTRWRIGASKTGEIRGFPGNIMDLAVDK